MSHGGNAKEKNPLLSEHLPNEIAKHPEIALELRQTLTLDHLIVTDFICNFVIFYFTLKLKF